jgi:hypothetical protein
MIVTHSISVNSDFPCNNSVYLYQYTNNKQQTIANRDFPQSDVQLNIDVYCVKAVSLYQPLDLHVDFLAITKNQGHSAKDNIQLVRETHGTKQRTRFNGFGKHTARSKRPNSTGSENTRHKAKNSCSCLDHVLWVSVPSVYKALPGEAAGSKLYNGVIKCTFKATALLWDILSSTSAPIEPTHPPWTELDRTESLSP